jgi:hypothetical protein
MPGARYEFTRDRGIATRRRTRGRRPEAWTRSKGRGAGKRRELICFFERHLAAPRRIWGIPAAFQGFPPPGLSPGGRGEPQVVVARVTPRVPDTAARPRYRNASSSTPCAGRDGGKVRAEERPGISLSRWRALREAGWRPGSGRNSHGRPGGTASPRRSPARRPCRAIPRACRAPPSRSRRGARRAGA